MSERKVLNKYFPPDFDPKKISALRERKQGGIKTGPKQQVVRLMAPFSMRCNTCGEYIYKGKKFNARKETAKGEQYYGIKIFRFYIKCTQCSAEITFKTDPKNTDYVAEHGAQRNFEVWRTDGTEGDAEETAEERLDRIEREMADDPMAELEAKQVDSKREMDILDALQEIRTRNARMERADADEVLNRVAARAAQEGIDVPVGATEEELRRLLEAEEDEAEVRRVFGRLKSDAALPAVKALPAIELNEPLEDEEVDQEGEAGPVASGSGTSASVPAASSVVKGDGALAMPPPPVPKVPTVKRKLAEVEPDALSLLSEDARKFASSVTFGAAKPKAPIKTGLAGLVAPPKKKLNVGSKFGIAPKAKPKA